MKRIFTIERVLLATIVALQVAIFISMWKREPDSPHAPAVSPVSPVQSEQADYPAFRSSLHPFLSPRPVRSLFHEMDAMMENAFRDMERMTALMGRDAGWDQIIMSPTMDMREIETNYVVCLSLPGFESSDIRVTLDGRILTVLSTRAESSDATRQFNQFKRRIQLPGPVGDGSLARAFLTNGVLKVTVPRQTVASMHSPSCRRLF